MPLHHYKFHLHFLIYMYNPYKLDPNAAPLLHSLKAYLIRPILWTVFVRNTPLKKPISSTDISNNQPPHFQIKKR